MARDAPHAGDFPASKLRESILFEVAFVGVTAAHCLASVAARLSDTTNSVPVICSGAILVSHLTSVWLRRRTTCLFWPPICALVLDSACVALGSTTLQHELWEVLWGRVLPGEPSGDPSWEGVHWDRLWATFFAYVILNYFSSFVMSFRQVLVAVPAAAAMYTAATAAGQFVFWSKHWDSHVISNAIFIMLVEFALFFGGIALTAYSKKRSDRVELRLFELSVAQGQIIIEEKVMRCQAEFRLEVSKGARVPGVPNTTSAQESVSSGKRRRSEASEKESQAQLSILSAPANMTPSMLASFLTDAVGSTAAGASEHGCLESKELDCLPLDAKVWIEGSTSPSPLEKLAPGQRVLCYDALGNDVRYVDVVEARADFEDVEWVTVTLEDGTELTMTSDHPVQPRRLLGAGGKQSMATAAVKAADLSPSTDSVVVHRVVTRPVAVRAVSQPQVCQSRGRMYVTMQQPDRHSLLVAGPGAQTDVRSMAVGSADAGAAQPVLELRNTFLNLSPSGAESERALARRARRPVSEPPSFKAGRFHFEEAPGHAEEALEDCYSEANPSTISPESREAEIDVKVPCTDTTAAGAPSDGRRAPAARVSDLLFINRMGWRSLGSRGHADSDCQYCNFHGKAYKLGGCRMGKFCNNCHVDEEHKLQYIRGGVRRKKRGNGSDGGQ